METLIYLYILVYVILLIPKKTRKIGIVLALLPAGIIVLPLMLIFGLAKGYK